MVLKLLAALAGVYLLLVALVWLFQRRLIYLPGAAAPRAAGSVLPGARDVSFETEDGLRLGAWFVPAPGAPSGSSVLVFDGNAGDRSHRAPLAAALAGAGHSVLLFDYRGYAGNPGHPTEEGLRADARAARAFLVGLPGVVPSRIVYLGESLGSAVAIALAAESPPAALVVRSPFPSLVEVGHRHYPILPVGLLLGDRWSSAARITRVSCPLLVIAGERDRLIPPDLSRRLFEMAPGPKRFVLIPGADHNDIELLAGGLFLEEVLRFIGESSGAVAERSPASAAASPSLDPR